MLKMGAKALHTRPGIDSRNERHTDSVNMVSDNVQERPDTRQHGRPSLCAGTWRRQHIFNVAHVFPAHPLSSRHFSPSGAGSVQSRIEEVAAAR